jgi:hypothetical protein
MTRGRLEYAPTTGVYSLYRCAHERWRHGLPPLCAPLCAASGCGISADLAGDTRALYLGHDALLVVHPPTGSYAVLRVQRAPAKLIAPPLIAPATDGMPAATAAGGAADSAGLRGTLPHLSGREVAYVGNNVLVALDERGKHVHAFQLARNASEVWTKKSPLRATLSVAAGTAQMLGAGARVHGGA